MERRYEAYKTHVVKPFFREHIARLDRQIVLIDAMQALNAGAGAMADLERAVTEILGCFRPGRGSFLTDLFSRRIDRILIAATKADHLHHESHDRLQAIVRRLADRAVARANFSGAEVDVLAMAAVRATREGTVKQGRETLPVIIGTPLDGETIGKREIRRQDRNRDISRRLAGESRIRFSNSGIRHMKRSRAAAGPLRAVPAAEDRAHGRRRDAVAAAYQARPRAAVPDRRPAGMSEPRRPAAFRIEPQARGEAGRANRTHKHQAETARKPRALAKSDVAIVMPAEIDVFAGDDRHRDQRTAAGGRPAPPLAARRDLPRRARHRWSRWRSACGPTALIRDLFTRADWLGWLAAGVAAIAALSLIVILARELLALARLASVEKIRKRALDAIARDDPKAARAVVDELSLFVAGQAGDRGRPPRARRPARRDHRRRQSGPARRGRDPRRRSTRRQRC